MQSNDIASPVVPNTFQPVASVVQELGVVFDRARRVGIEASVDRRQRCRQMPDNEGASSATRDQALEEKSNVSGAFG